MSHLERAIYDKFHTLFPQMGYDVCIPQRQRGHTYTPDFVISSIDQKYKIAVEVKGSNHIYGNFFSYVSDMFARLQKTDSYDKFLLVSDHIKNVNNHFSHHGSSSNIEIIDIDEIHNWIERLEQSSSDQSENPYDILIHLRKFNKSIIRCIACAPEQLYNLEWRDTERVIAELFEGIGFNVTLTRCSKDGGKDIILEYKIGNSTKSYIIEIKHWKSKTKVNKNSVKRFTQIVVNENREKGLMISTFGYTRNYYESLTEHELKKVCFGTRNKIVDLCKTYEKIRGGIWVPLDLEGELQKRLLRQSFERDYEEQYHNVRIIKIKSSTRYVLYPSWTLVLFTSTLTGKCMQSVLIDIEFVFVHKGNDFITKKLFPLTKQITGAVLRSACKATGADRAIAAFRSPSAQ